MNAYNTEDLSRLEPDYLESFGLHEAPFSNLHHDKFLYIDADRAQALNLLQHLTHYSNLLLMVQGEQGVGKTAMLQRFIKNAEPDWRICEVSATTMMDAEQLLFQAAQGFGVTRLPEDDGQLQEMLYARVATLHHNDQVPILLIDDAHLLPRDALLTIFNLADAYVNDVNLLRIILFCDPLIEKIINSKDVRLLRERITHTLEITAFDEEATADYLKHRLAVAGFNGGSPFTPKMIKKIYRSSQGVPEKINEFAHQALELGDIEQAVAIPEDVVAISRQQRNNMPILFVSIAVVVIALVLVFQEKINRLFDEDGKTVEVAVVPPDTQSTIPRQEDKSDKPIPAQPPLQEKIIPLKENNASALSEEPRVNAAAMPNQPEVTQSAIEGMRVMTTDNPTAQSDTELANTSPVKLLVLEPNPVPASNQRQTITLNGEGFTSDSEVIVSWSGKQKKLSADQVKIKDDKQIDININVGNNEDQWSVLVTNGNQERSNLLNFKVKSILVDQGYQRDKWVVTQNPEHFTLQLFGSHDKQNADRFIAQHKLAGDAGYFESVRNGKPWYSVVYGSYADQAAAKTAISSLPAPLNKVKPWVRRFDDIHASINAIRKVLAINKPNMASKTGPLPKRNRNEENNESWLWSQDPSNFTLQLLGARRSDSIQQFLHKYSDLNGKAVYFHTRHDARDWYTVIYGVYSNREQAQMAVKRLPSELQTASPWIRSFGSIHSELGRTDSQ